MNIKIGHCVAVPMLLLLAACNEDNNERGQDPLAMTAEKYALIDMTIDAMVDESLFPTEGSLLVSDRTSIGEAALGYVEGEAVDLRTALDSFFPFQELPWSAEESDLAFGGYFRQNVEPATIREGELAVFARDMTLLSHDTYEEYTAEDPFFGWEQLYAEYPDLVGYVRFGNPVIFENAGFALVHVDFMCGPSCGTSFYGLLRLNGSAWEFTEWYVDWYG